MINSAYSALPDPGTQLGAWEVVRPLGRGGMAVVYEVRAEDGRVGALKLVHPRGSDRAEVEARFRRELRALSRLHHPNIVAVLDSGQWQGRDWFVMDLIQGRDLRVEVDLWESAPPTNRWETVRRITEDVARALSAVHAAGLVHRDVTPGNVRIGTDGRAHLMDFGVAKESLPAQVGDDELTSHGELLGTVAWMSPEQIAGDTVDERADLYSLGALVYLMLTGRRPFHARTLAGYLDKHLHQPVRPPRELVPAIPPELEDLCVRCLEKDPALRFASARHLLLALEAEPQTRASLALWPEELVGWQIERGAVAAAVDACGEGRGGVVVISGGTGLGKSRLARLASDGASAAGCTVHTLVGDATKGGLDTFLPLVESLVAAAAVPPPVLRALLGNFGESVVLERFGVFAAIRDLLLNTPPRVIVVDDVHRLNATSLELLDYLLRTTRELSNEAILWVLTRGPDAAGITIPTSIELHILPLQAVEELLTGVLGASAAVTALARRLHREGEGNPAFIVEMVRGLVDERMILVDENGRRHLRLDDAAVNRAALPIPRSARDALLAQMSRLGPDATSIVRVLAIAGQELSIEAVADVLHRAEADLCGAVEEAVEQGIIRERTVEGVIQVDIAHVRTREVVARSLGLAERTALHRRVGETLERVGRHRIHLVVDALAHHFEAGEMPGKAYSYLLRSGTRFLERSFTREALARFSRAVALEPEARELLPLDDADRALCDLLLKRSEALEASGEWALLDTDLARATVLADELADDRLGARVRSATGRRARQTGDFPRAERCLVEALRLTERAGDHPTRAIVLNQLGTAMWSRGDLEAARRHWVEGLAVAEGARAEGAIGHGYNGLGLVAACRGQAAESRRNFEQAAAVFERLGLVGALTMVRGNLVEVLICTGNLRRGLELAEKSVTHAREVNHAGGMVLARSAFADVLTHLGRVGEARVEAEAATAAARGLGEGSSLLTALISLLRARWSLGETAEMAAMIEETLALAVEFDQEGWAGIVHAWRARLAALDGQPVVARDAIRLAIEAPGTRWPYQEVRLDLALSRAFSLLDDPMEAVRHADAAIRRADACGYRLYVLKGHIMAAAGTTVDADKARHTRVADALGRALAANLPVQDAERFLASSWLRS